MTLSRRCFLCTTAVAALAARPYAAPAQAYPVRSIKIVAPILPGSPMDVVGRLVAQKMQRLLGQPVVIENRPGGGQAIGARSVAAADPDGYTLLLFNNGHYFGLTPNAGYDPVGGFEPVATLAAWNHLLVLRPDFPADTVGGLIASARENPHKVTFGFGASTPPQILGETLKHAAGVDIASIPYRSGATAVTDVLGGRIDLNIGTAATLLPSIQQGKLKVIGYTGVARTSMLPEVPTMIECGYPQLAFNPDTWIGVSAPAGTPASVTAKLNEIISEALNSSEIAASFTALSVEKLVKSPHELAPFITVQAAKWPPIVRAAGLMPE
jgi:tripartite-type tricarboxylate transporter receptor subunit TctC